jgi:hypothetical protein
VAELGHAVFGPRAAVQQVHTLASFTS